MRLIPSLFQSFVDRFNSERCDFARDGHRFSLPMNRMRKSLEINAGVILRFMGAMREKSRGILSSGERARVRAAFKPTGAHLINVGARALARFNVVHSVDIQLLINRSLKPRERAGAYPGTSLGMPASGPAFWRNVSKRAGPEAGAPPEMAVRGGAVSRCVQRRAPPAICFEWGNWKCHYE